MTVRELKERLEILIIRYIDVHGEYTKNYFPYRFMNEDEIIDMVLRSLY